MAEASVPGPTPLQAAAFAGHATICSLLLDSGADVARADQDGDTPLHLAVMSDDIETCRVILFRSSDATAVNRRGQTALEIALDRGDEDIVELLSAAASPSAEAIRPARPQLPLVSDDAKFLAFTDLPDPDDWLEKQFVDNSDKIRVDRKRLSFRWAPLNFWPGAKILALRTARHRAPSEQFALVWPGERFVLLNWTNEPFYQAADNIAPIFDDANAQLWCRVFFHFVRGQFGRFRIVEHPDDIIWTKDVLPSVRDEVAGHLRPLRVFERPPDDLIVLEGQFIFKNALFSSKILLATRPTEISEKDGSGVEKFSCGQSRLYDEKLLLGDLPVHVDLEPGRYG